MANAVWPSSLPQKAQRRGYGSVPVSATVGAPVDKGPPMSRPKFTGRTFQLTVPYKMTTAEKKTFEDTFFFTTLGNGSLAFDLPDPEDGADMPANITVMFPPGKKPYQKTPAGPGLWLITLNLITLP